MGTLTPNQPASHLQRELYLPTRERRVCVATRGQGTPLRTRRLARQCHRRTGEADGRPLTRGTAQGHARCQPSHMKRERGCGPAFQPGAAATSHNGALCSRRWYLYVNVPSRIRLIRPILGRPSAKVHQPSHDLTIRPPDDSPPTSATARSRHRTLAEVADLVEARGQDEPTPGLRRPQIVASVQPRPTVTRRTELVSYSPSEVRGQQSAHKRRCGRIARYRGFAGSGDPDAVPGSWG